MGFWKRLFDKWFGASSRSPKLTPVFPDTPPLPPYAPLNVLPTRPVNPPPYRVFTREFDTVVMADELNDVLEWGHQPGPAVQGPVSQAADDLHPDWRPDLERIAAEALIHLSKKARPTACRDTAVCILVDLSGSMRGLPIRLAAIAVDVALNLILKLGCTAEILGFTTSSWLGGLSRQTWIATGRKPEPGRLCDLLHVVFRPANGTGGWAMADMLHPELLKENIDGEALEWAVARLRALPQRRKVLIVVSDGAPVDDSTLSTNDAWILERHLRQVIKEIESFGDIHLAAVGIGYDVDRYYKRASTFVAEDLGRGLISTLTDVMEAAFLPIPRRRPRNNPPTPWASP